MSDGIARRLGAHVWREPGGWHGVEPAALAQRLRALLDVEPPRTVRPTGGLPHRR